MFVEGKMKKLLYMIILMVVVASLSGCNKIEQEQESKMEVNSVTENEVEANNIEESVSGYAASFPENYTAVVENVEFDMEIVVDADLMREGLISGKATLQKVNEDIAFEHLFKGISDYEVYTYEGENEFGETVDSVAYRKPKDTYDIQFTYGPESSKLGYYGDSYYIKTTFIADTKDERYNADLFSKEADLSFMSRSEAFRMVENLLKEIGIEAEYEYVGYALNYETMQSEEYHEDINGNVDKSAYKGQWSKEDDSYYFFINQMYRQLPVYYKYYELFTEVTDMNMPIQAIVAKDGIKELDIQKVFTFSEEKEIEEVASIEEIAATVADKFNQILGTGTYETTEARFYYYVDVASGQGEYEVKPIWIIKGTEKKGGQSVQIIIDAQNAKEILP